MQQHAAHCVSDDADGYNGCKVIRESLKHCLSYEISIVNFTEKARLRLLKLDQLRAIFSCH